MADALLSAIPPTKPGVMRERSVLYKIGDLNWKEVGSGH
jgi:hypothetical protein